MDRNREGRRSGMVASAATSNGLSSRRRHNRSNSLRDSPDGDGGVEIQESVRLRERVKKDRDRERDRERDNRDRDRDRTNRSKRRRGVGDDSSEESVNDDEEEDDEDNTTSNSVVAVGVSASSTRSLQPAPAIVGSISNHHHHHHHHHYNNNNLHHLQPPRKSFPPKVFRAAAPVWKPGDEMIGVSVPRKARSASTKRSHDWISGTGGVVTGDQIHQPASTTSPSRQNIPATSTTPSPAAPLSPSSSNVSSRKKTKSCNGPKRPPAKSPPKAAATSSNPEELEIEIAEVLYGLMTQSQQGPPPKKESGGPNDASREVNNRSRVSSPASNSNSSAAPPLLAVAPKRKRPRQVLENPGGFGIRSSPISPSATGNKVEMMDQTTLKMEVSSPINNLEKSATENGVSYSTSDPVAEPMKVESEAKRRPEESEFVESKEEVISPKRESSSVVAENSNSVVVAATHVTGIVTEAESQREDKFQIDLMAPPPQLRSSPEREAEMDRVSVAVDNNKPILAENLIEMKPLDDDRIDKAEKVERVSIEEGEEKKTKAAAFEEVNPPKTSGSNFDLQLDLERPEKDSGTSSKFQQHSQKLQQQQPPPPQKESISDKTGLPSSLPMSMSMASWPGGLPPMGYMAPLQGVVAMDGTALSSAPIQPLFSQPRPKRCATHCYIARNIHYLQQFMKMHPFWPPAAASSAPFFGPKSNMSVMPTADLHGNLSGRGVSAVPEKGQGLAIFPTSNNCGKDKVQPPNIADSAQRKQQQMLLQQALPPVAPNNLLHAPAFIFPLNHQQQAMAAAAVRPGPARSPSTMGTSVSSNASNPSTGSAPSATAATAISFNYPNISPNEAQYLAILQNNAYAFPMPAAPPNYRGTHPQPLPLFNGSFYPSQMIHPSQVPPQQQQQQPPPTSQSQQMQQQGQQNTSMSSGSSSSQKHLHNQQQRSQGNAVNGGSGGGNLHNYHGSKNHPSQSSAQSQNQHIPSQNQHIPSQPRQIENDVGSESPSSASERKRSHGPTNMYNQNFAMPIHPSNFGLMTPPSTFGVASSAGGTSSHQTEKKPQQQPGVKTSLDSVPPQPFAMSFSSFNGASAAPGIDMSMAQNHAIFQSLPEATRQNLQMAAAAAAQAVQQKKNFRVSEDGKPGSGSDQSGADAERKSLAMKPSGNAGGQSIAFSRPDMSDASGSSSTIAANSVIDSSSRSLNLPSGASWNARAAMPNAMGAVNVPNAQLQAQFQHQQHQQQQMIQLHKQQQQQQQQMAAAAVARSKAPTSTNGNVYSDHFTSSASATSKYPNSMSAIPQNLVQTGNNVQAQLTQWKSANRTATAQAPSSMSSSSLKSSSHQQQQQQARTQQTLTQISFGTNPKSGGPPQGQQPPNSNQSPSSPMMVGSPTSSISRGASGSPRTTNSASTSNKTGQNSSLSTQQQQPGKSSPSAANQKSSPAGGRNVPSILGNPHHVASTSSGGSKSQMQQQLQQQHLQKGMQQAQLYFSSPYVQSQPPPHASGTSSTGQPTGGYYIQRRRSEQAGQLPPGSSSSGMLTLCPVNLGGGGSTTSDPAKAIAAAAAANNNMKGGVLTSQGIHQYAPPTSGSQHPLLPAGFPYHPVPAAVQVKPAEQKQPAGNDNLHACWQPEKK